MSLLHIPISGLGCRGDLLQVSPAHSQCLRATSLHTRRRMRWQCSQAAGIASDSVPVTVGRDGSLLFRFFQDSSASESPDAEAQPDDSRDTSADGFAASSNERGSFPVVYQQHAGEHPDFVHAESLVAAERSKPALPLSIRDAQDARDSASRHMSPSGTLPDQDHLPSRPSPSGEPATDLSDGILFHRADLSVSAPPSDPDSSQSAAGGHGEQSHKVPPPPLPTSQQQFYERQRLQADQRQQQRTRGLESVPETDSTGAETPSQSDASNTAAAGAEQTAGRHIDPTASHAAAVAAVRSLQSRVADHSSLTGARRDRESRATHDAAQVAEGHALLQSRGLSASASDDISLLEAFSDLAEKGQLQQALSVVIAFKVADRRGVMSRLMHRHFLKAATRRRDVNAALQFVQLLPQNVADARTYTMLISVCAAAGDAASALRAADSWREMGRKLDTRMYTNVITACAKAGDADAATLVYQRMRAEGCPLDRNVFAALISAFNAAVRQRRGASQRRPDLVLLERAFNLVDDMRDAELEPDVVTYNTLVSLAGQAGQLQRAMDTVTEMEMRGCRPDQYTFTSLIDACSRSNQTETAREVYARAMRSNVVQGPALYSAAVSACRAGAPPDAAHAMNIYQDMLRNGVQPDARLYSSLMSVAGAAQDPALAFSLLDEMTDEGVRQCSGTLSSLVVVCVLNNQVDRAHEVYKTMRTRKVVPSMRAFNSLVGATGKAYGLAGVADILADMAAVGCAADTFTYSAVLSSCQWAQEADLALDVYRLMHSQGIRVGDFHAFSIVRICFNVIRSMWRPGGYPPSSDACPNLPGSGRSREGTALLAALGGTPSSPAESPSDVAGWQACAVKVYKEALQGGLPSLRLLDRVLGCLREPLPAESATRDNNSWQNDTSWRSSPRRLPTNRLSAPKAAFPPNSEASPDVGSTWQVRARYSDDKLRHSGKSDIQSEGLWGRMQDKAIALVEEAVSLRILPAYNLSDSLTVDFRHMPANVAEVYALAILNSLYRRKRPRRWERVDHAIAFLVPVFDSHRIMQPSEPHSESVHSSHQHHNHQQQQQQQHQQQQQQQQQEGQEAGEQGSPSGALFQAKPATALAVAAAVKRLKVHAAIDAINGAIMMQPQELTRWVRDTSRAEANQRGAPSQGLWEGYRMRTTPIARQAADIRMRGKGNAAPQSQPSWQSVLQSGGNSITNPSNFAVDEWWNETDGRSNTDSNQRFYDGWDDDHGASDRTDSRRS